MTPHCNYKPRSRAFAARIAAATFSLICAYLWATAATEGGQSPSQGGPKFPSASSAAAKAPDGYQVEIYLEDLTFPTSIEFDDVGTAYVAEAGYSYGMKDAEAQITRYDQSGNPLGPVSGHFNGPINDLLWHDGRLYVSHRGEISVVENGQTRDLVTGLPSHGDHQNNQLTVGPDGWLYFGQGTATNSGVVGLDNYKMGWLKAHPDFHDVSPQPMRMNGRVYATENPLTDIKSDQAETGPFRPFGKSQPGADIFSDQVKANGTVLRMQPDGSRLEVYAWGLRNPFGLQWSPDGQLYATENGADVRGSRPIAADKDDLYLIKEGAWYGWPDYGSGIPFTDKRFKPEGKPQPQFLMAEHPPVEQPVTTFPVHSSVAKLSFAPEGEFGYEGQVFIAFFGHMAPMTGSVAEHGGHRVMRLDLETMESETFFTAKHQENGQGGHDPQRSDSTGSSASAEATSGAGHHSQAGPSGDSGSSAGPRRLLDVQFSPDGDSLYIVDFGVMRVDKKGIHPEPNTGVVWRVSRDE